MGKGNALPCDSAGNHWQSRAEAAVAGLPSPPPNHVPLAWPCVGWSIDLFSAGPRPQPLWLPCFRLKSLPALRVADASKITFRKTL